MPRMPGSAIGLRVMPWALERGAREHERGADL